MISYVSYGILIILTLWGIKFSGFKKIDEDFLDKDYTKAICGIAAIMIILHHISLEASFQDVTGELGFYNGIGYLLVTVFMFYSGYGLVTSVNKNPKYLDTFLKRRLPIILVPFYVNNIVYAIYYGVQGVPISKVLLGITGLVPINPNGWYPVVIFILYMAFYFANKKIKSKGLRVWFYFLVDVLMICIFCVNTHNAWYLGSKGYWLKPFAIENSKWWMQSTALLFSGEWWVNSSIGFVIGSLFATYKEKIINFFKKGYWIKLIILIVLFRAAYVLYIKEASTNGYWTEYRSFDPGIKDKFVCSFYQFFVSLFFICSFVVLTMKVKTKNIITSFMGKISYETYLFGVIPLEVFDFLIYQFKNGELVPVVNNGETNLIIYTVLVVICSIVLGFLFNKFDNLLVKKITKN